jgi:hypothetical protein
MEEAEKLITHGVLDLVAVAQDYLLVQVQFSLVLLHNLVLRVEHLY